MDGDLTQPITPPPDTKTTDVPPGPRGAGRFVVIFTICVLVLLTGYRFAIRTTASDRYLFEVSRHTAWLLDAIGYSAELEKYSAAERESPEDSSTPYGALPESTGDSSAPLSPWERWRNRARAQQGTGEIGPRITFVLHPGLQQAIAIREKEMAAIQSGEKSMPPDEVASLDQQINMLKRRIEEIAADPSSTRERLGVTFSFYVVPSCGAIEVMAIFFAAVVAFPATWRHRVRGLAVGLPLMYLVNILRLACLACLGALDQGGAWFNFVHEYVWQSVYVIFVVLVWMAWVELGRRKAA